MKQTTSNKPRPYFNRIKAAHDALVPELKAAEEALALANADYAEKKKLLSEFNNPHYLTAEERQATFEASAAKNRVGSIKNNISSLKSQIAPLHRIISAPEEFAQAKKSLEELQGQKRQLTADVARVDGVLDKLSKRIDAANACIADSTLTAAYALTTEDGFTVPESLVKAEMELRLSKVSQAQLEKEKAALKAKMGELSEAFKEAKHLFIFYRAVVAETDLYEQLEPLMPLVAKAAAARRENDGSRASEWVLKIEEEAIDSADLDLDAELAELV
jgi:predicted  nucleic acid-binding Zn-ribbon protein